MVVRLVREVRSGGHDVVADGTGTPSERASGLPGNCDLSRQNRAFPNEPGVGLAGFISVVWRAFCRLGKKIGQLLR